jgi:hypothetical protein
MMPSPRLHRFRFVKAGFVAFGGGVRVTANEDLMLTGRCMCWVRRVLVAGLCYALVLQTLLLQAAAVAAANPDAQGVLCHGNGDQSPGDGADVFAGCHSCSLPASGAALLPDAGPAVSVRIAVTASAFFFFSAPIIIVRPPPRGESRAPPDIA